MDLFVIGSNYEVVTFGMHVDGRDPLCSGLVLGHDHLLLQVVLENLDMSAGEKVGTRGVKAY
jgi:hypothetical protein